MKGIILSGGSGTRLKPLTRVTSKQLLPVYDKPMIYYPLYTLLRAGIKEIMIIVAPEHSGDYLNLLGSGSQFGVRFTYEVQDEPLGLAHGLSLAETFADGQSVAFILGDNIYEDDFATEINNFRGGAKIFAKDVNDPKRFGVVEFDQNMNVLSIEEKPAQPKSNYAQTGLYIYDYTVFDKIRTLKPSARGELEITDLHNIFLQDGHLKCATVKGEWIDAGTTESLYQAGSLARKLVLSENLQSLTELKREVGPFSGLDGSVSASQFVKPEKKTKILVTGGAGFMGSNMIRYLFSRYADIEIVNLDKLTYAGNLKNLLDIEKDPRYTFVKGDIADRNIVDDLFRRFQFDCVINYAAETHVDRSILEPDAFLKTDILGTHNLLEAVKKYDTPKMIQISTDEVYGEAPVGEFYETSPFQPNSPYSASKAGGDHLCRAYFKTYSTPVVITHSCNFYGPYQYPEKLIPLFITNLLEGKKVPVYGDGKQVREWIYTEDHCSAVDAVRLSGKAGEVYNIGTGQRKMNIEVTHTVLSLLGLDVSYIEYVKDRAGHDVRYAVNFNKIQEQLQWKPEHSFEERLQDTVKWYADNSSWWQEIKSGTYMEYYKKQYVNR